MHSLSTGITCCYLSNCDIFDDALTCNCTVGTVVAIDLQDNRVRTGFQCCLTVGHIAA